jgi:hypothetical protein
MMILDGENPDSTGTKERVPANDQRINIGESLSNIEVFALACAFGASPLTEEVYHSDRWNVFNCVKLLNGAEALMDCLYGIFDRLIDKLRQQTNMPKPEIEFCDNVCKALGFDRDAIWSKVVEEIPEPKSWAKNKKDASEEE